MKPYYAGIQQSRETITRYSRVQFNIFKSRTKLAVICFAAGLVVIGLALLTSYKALAVILVFLGCIVFANQDAGADYTANLVIAQMLFLEAEDPDKDIYLYEGFAQNPGW